MADVPAFDLLTGSAEARTRIDALDDPRAIAEDLARLRPADEEIAHAAIRAAARVTL